MILAYNYNNKRMGVLLDGLPVWADDGLSCGTTLQVKVNQKWVHDRLEMSWDSKWYLVKSKLEGNQLEGVEVRFSDRY